MRIFTLLLLLFFQIACRNSNSKEIKTAEEDASNLVSLYFDNSLETGDFPYSLCYGDLNKCRAVECSEIEVLSSYSTDVIVSIKFENEVYRHAYIKSQDRYTFNVPNGKYQVFFYYGNGWDPTLKVNKSKCGLLKGAFVNDVSYSKDVPLILENQKLTYELFIQSDGNLKTIPSSAVEFF